MLTHCLWCGSAWILLLAPQPVQERTRQAEAGNKTSHHQIGERSLRTVMAVEDYLIPLLEEAEIAHHIPGRIRLRFNHSIVTKLPKLNGIEKEIQKLANQIEAIKNIRLNLFAGSVVVQYNTEILSPDFWQEVVAEKDIEQLKEKAMILFPGLQF